MNQNRIHSTVTSIATNVTLSGDDQADIRSLFTHTPRSFAIDERDLRHAAARTTNVSPLTFALRSVFPSNNT